MNHDGQDANPTSPNGCTVLLVLWGLFIVYGTLLPFDFTTDTARASARIHTLGQAFQGPVSWADVVSNVLLFLPWGFLIGCRLLWWRLEVAKTVAVAALSGLLLSGAVECAQLFIPSRTTSLIDLVTNTSGAVLGALLSWLVVRRGWPAGLPTLTRFVSARPMAACALAAAAGLVFAGLSPFDVSIDPGDLKTALKQAQLIPFGPTLRGPAPPPDPWAWLQEGLAWALMGGLTVIALREARYNGLHGFALAVALCGGLAVGIEATQLVILSRRADMTSAVLALSGATAGAAIVAFSAPRPPRAWIGPALTVWTLTVLLAAWTPPHWAPSLARSIGWSQLIPFWSYYRKTDLNALADLFNQVLSFVPLGVLVAVRHTQNGGRRALALGLGLGFILECGQLALADRTAEITDVVSAGAGAALGARLWAWGVSLRTSASGHARYRIR